MMNNMSLDVDWQRGIVYLADWVNSHIKIHYPKNMGRDIYSECGGKCYE